MRLFNRVATEVSGKKDRCKESWKIRRVWSQNTLSFSIPNAHFVCMFLFPRLMLFEAQGLQVRQLR